VRKSENRIIIIIVHNFRRHVNGLIYTGFGGGVWGGMWERRVLRFQGDAFTEGKRCLVRPNVRDISIVTPCRIVKKNNFHRQCVLSYDHNYKVIIFQQIATEYILFKSVNCSIYFGFYFTRNQEIITMSQHYVAFMDPYCRYSVMRSWWKMKYRRKHVVH